MKVMDESAGSADREMGIIQDSLSFKINALKETWTGFLQGLIDKDALGGILDVFVAISNGATSLISVLGELNSVLSALIALSISRFTGKNFFNFDKETGKILFQNPFKKESENENLTGLSPSEQKLEGTRAAIAETETKIDELNTKEITLGSNSVALENLEQVEAKAQEVIATLDEATAAFQQAQIAVNEERENVIASQTPLVEEPEFDEVGQQWSDYLAEQESEVVVTPVIDEPALKQVSEDISDVASGKKTYTSSKKKNRSAKRKQRKEKIIEQENALTPEAEQWESLAVVDDEFATKSTTAPIEASTTAIQANTAANVENANSQAILAQWAQTNIQNWEESVAATTAGSEAIAELGTSASSSSGVLVTLSNAVTAFGAQASTVATAVSAKVAMVGKALLATFGNFFIIMAAMKGFELAIKGIDYLINKNQKMVEAGKAAADSISTSIDNYNNKVSSIKTASSALGNDNLEINSTSDSIDNLANKYIELSKGVDTLSNKNLSLNDEDYQSFLDTSNQLAEVLPELVSKYDANGNAILNLGNNAEEAGKKIKEALEFQQLLSHYDILDNVKDQIKGIQSQDEMYHLEDMLNSNMKINELKGKINAINDAKAGKDSIFSGFKDTDLDKFLNDYNVQLKEEEFKISSLEKQIEQNYKTLIPTIKGLLETTPEFSNLNSTIQTKLLESIGDLTGEQVKKMITDSKGDASKLMSDLTKSYITPFENIEQAGMTDRLLGLFDIDKSKMKIDEYLGKVNNELQTIFKDDTSQIPVWENILGINELNSQREKINNILLDTTDNIEVTISEFDSLTMGNREIAYDLIVNNKFEGTFAELKEKIKEVKEELKNGLDATPLLDKYNQAVQDASDNGNQGKNYDAYGEALKSLKEQYDKGLIGTDTFKKGAKMFSASGATDPDIFIKNYERLSKYWNEESPIEGVRAFAEEMEKLDLMEKTDDGGFKSKFDDIREAAAKAKMPLELFISMFDKMEEFGGTSDFFITKEEGFETLGEITGELAVAKAEYEQLLNVKPENRDKSAIKAKEEEIESLQGRLKDAKKELIEFLNNGGLKEYTENYKEQSKAAQEGLYKLNHSKAFQKADKEQKNIMLEAVRSGFENSGLDPSIYKNLGFNKNGAMVLDVEASNDRVDKVLGAYYSTDKEEHDKKFSYYGDKTAEQLVNEWAKNLGLSTEDYLNKMKEEGGFAPEEVKNTEDTARENVVSAINGATAALNSLTTAIAGQDPGKDGKNIPNSSKLPNNLSTSGTPTSQFGNTSNNLNQKKDLPGHLANIGETTTTSKITPGSIISGILDFLFGGSKVSAAEVPDDYISRHPNKSFDYTSRQKVGYEDIESKGWDSYATVKTDEETGKEYVVTPVLPNGDVLDKTGFDSYINSVMAGGVDTDNLVISTFEGKGASKAANDYAQALNKVSNAYSSADESARTAIEGLQEYSYEELQSINLTDDSTSKMEDQFTSLMDSLGISSDQAEQFINVMRDMGLLKVTPQVDLSEINKIQSTDELNDKLSGSLEVGQSITYIANVEGVEKEVKAVEEQEGTITYYAKDLEGVEKEVKPVADQKGTIKYTFETENDDKLKDKTGNKDGGTIKTKVTSDTKDFDKKTSEVQAKLKKVDSQKANPHVSLSGAGSVKSQLSSISSKMSSLNNKEVRVTLTTIKKTIIKTDHSNSGGGGHSFNGTFHTANAYATGTTSMSNVSVEKDETALINELGKEIVVRDGKALTFNNGYPVYANLKKGDIVFNHKFEICGLVQRCA